VLRGSAEARESIAFWQRQQVVTAAMNVNTWDVNDTLRGLVGRTIDAGRLADERIPLADL
jgi:3-phenylpropionate/trans-cinnamate dioxygenase ferredoxin reductase subunit